MQGIGGLELTRRIVKMIRLKEIVSTLIIQCTAYGSEEDIRRVMQAGAHGFISKPVNYLKLLQSIKSGYK